MSETRPNKYRVITNGTRFAYEIGTYFCGAFKSGYRWRTEMCYPGFNSYEETVDYIRKRYGDIADIERPWRAA